MRLKLYLSLLWHSAAAPFDVTATAYSWATLLGLPDPDRSGKRRIQDAITWLATNQFVEVTLRPGRHPTLRPLREDGSGEPYTLPGPEAEPGKPPSFRQLQAEFWTNGWITKLSGPAIAVWLAYVDAKGANNEDPWISERQTRDRYGLTDDTRKKGLKELIAAGLVERRYARLREPFRSDRPITHYRLYPTRFAIVPPVDDATIPQGV